MGQEDRINGIPTRMLGSTGVRVTVLGVGGYHVGCGNAQTGVRIVRAAVDEGVNFLDNAWCYNSGRSEEIMGEALRGGYRERVFLMTKNHGRDAATFARQLDESLKRFHTDRIDLVQFHDIEDEGLPGRILAPGGAIEAALRAREHGKIRFIGFTGHSEPSIHRLMLDRDFPWDTVQMPVSLLDMHYRSFIRGVLPVLKERGIGAIGMKSLSSGKLLQAGVSAREAIRFALSRPIDVLVSGMDSLEVLRENLATVRSFEPMGEAEGAELIERVADFGRDGRLERHKRKPHEPPTPA